MKSTLAQGYAVLDKHTAFNTSKNSRFARNYNGPGLIHSRGTLDKRARSLSMFGTWLFTTHGYTTLRRGTPELAQEYLQYRAESGKSTSTLNSDRRALEYIVGQGKVTNTKGLPHEKRDRAYSRAQVDRLKQGMSYKNALSTEITYIAGLRAHELLTIRRWDEATPSQHRAKHWIEDRFIGRTGIRYIVTGKGGLRREIILPEDLSRELEKCRLPEPITVKDRKIYYEKHYDIGGGQAWSQCISRTSKKVLGWSHGGHGMRYGYAQTRMGELLRMGYSYQSAKLIVSQELGHFRKDVTNAYLPS